MKFTENSTQRDLLVELWWQLEIIFGRFSEWTENAYFIGIICAIDNCFEGFKFIKFYVELENFAYFDRNERFIHDCKCFLFSDTLPGGIKIEWNAQLLVK